MRATRWRSFVSNEGEVIFKKYSPISELGSIAAQYCEVLFRTAGYRCSSPTETMW